MTCLSVYALSRPERGRSLVLVSCYLFVRRLITRYQRTKSVAVVRRTDVEVISVIDTIRPGSDIGVAGISDWTSCPALFDYRIYTALYLHKAVIIIAIRLRYDYDPTTTYRARLLPFDAIRREQKNEHVSLSS